MNEITYILGAGASYSSMPLVTTFAKRFKSFQNIIYTGSDNEDEKLLLDHCKRFSTHLESHLSFDTFFKKLFHQGLGFEIKLYKKILLLYFLYEHLVDLNEDPRNEHILGKWGKSFNIDPRYDALIAGLLKPLRGKVDFFSKVNFITWNYDLNLFRCLKNFLLPDHDIKYIVQHMNLGNSKSFQFSEQCKLLHLNGLMYYPDILNMEPLGTLDLRKFIYEAFNSFSNGELDSYSSHISFAWESMENDVLDPVMAIVKKCIERSKTIVIIGYSFPLYNRLIDAANLRKHTLQRKKIVIQDPDAVSLKNVLFESFNLRFSEGINSDDPSCEPITECKSFYVPKDVFLS